MKKQILTTVLLIFVISTCVTGAVPKTLSYQGVVTDTNGNPKKDGEYKFTFSIYDDSVSGGSLWSEEKTIQTKQGLFSTELGSVEPLTIPFDKQYWLQVEADGTVFPLRTKLTGAPYSFRADTAEIAKKLVDSIYTREQLKTSGKAKVHAGNIVNPEWLDGNPFDQDLNTTNDVQFKFIHSNNNTGLDINDVTADYDANSETNWNAVSPIKLANGNNTMAFFTGGPTNQRRSFIQVGHNNPVYGSSTGELWLNPFGGNVTINGNAAFHAGNFNPSNYYTKANLETSGQASVDAANVKNASWLKYAEYDVNVNNTNFWTVLDIDGDQITSKSDRVVYKISLITTGTGTRTGDVYLLHNPDGEGWEVSVSSKTGNGSNYPYVFIDNDVPKVRTDHSSTYTVKVYIEQVETGNISVRRGTIMGPWYNFASSVGCAIYRNHNGTEYSIWHSGNLNPETQSSDIRFKTDIDSINDPLKKVKSLKGISFNWKHSDFPDRHFPQGRQIGVIAQEVEKILPEVIRTDKDGYKSVAYDKLSAILIEAVKEQQKIIETQENKIENQKTEIDSIKNGFKEMEKIIYTIKSDMEKK